MVVFVTGLILFFALHLYTAFRSRDPQRDIKRRFGEPAYMGIYTLISIAGLVAMVIGVSDARAMASPISHAPGVNALTMILMAPALVALAAAYTPTGFIKRTLRHPMLTGVALWGLAHALTASDTASLLLFVAFLSYACIDVVAVTMRSRSGDVPEQEQAAARVMGDALAIVIGAAAYLAFWLVLHGWAIGIPLRATV